LLSRVAEQRQVSARKQNQALHALVFLDRHVLKLDLSELHNLVRSGLGVCSHAASTRFAAY